MTRLSELITAYLGGRGELTEGRVLSGEGYFVDGRLKAAIVDEDLCVRLGEDRWETAIAMTGIRPLEVAGRPVTGWVLVDRDSISGESDLAGWIENAVEG